MTDTTDARTIDWNRFWRETTEEERAGATPASQETPELILSFVEERAGPEAVADVGCGAGHVAFRVADQHTDTPVVGYDAAPSILAENRERAREEGIDNVRFEQVVLPEFDPERTFDLVVCYSTLHYVAEPERALTNLYEAVTPGGSLVFNYPNRPVKRRFRSIVGDPPSGETVRDIDPQQFARRFRLVIEGENLLSYDRIHEILGTWPRSLWPVVGESSRFHPPHAPPLVFVPKQSRSPRHGRTSN